MPPAPPPNVGLGTTGVNEDGENRTPVVTELSAVGGTLVAEGMVDERTGVDGFTRGAPDRVAGMKTDPEPAAGSNPVWPARNEASRGDSVEVEGPPESAVDPARGDGEDVAGAHLPPVPETAPGLEGGAEASRGLCTTRLPCVWSILSRGTPPAAVHADSRRAA